MAAPAPTLWTVVLIPAVLLILVPDLAVHTAAGDDVAVSFTVVDLTFSNRTRSSFTAEWDYEAAAAVVYGEPDAWLLTVDNVYATQLSQFELDGNRTRQAVEGVDSGTAYLVCVTPAVGGALQSNGTACEFVRTMFDPWDERGQAACYVGLGILAVCVALVIYDVLYPREASGGGGGDDTEQPSTRASAKAPGETIKTAFTSSTIELNEKMY